ncbi:DUF6223 family protein [Actinoplanes aureus]|uniref:Uncharacterized protein n=1 Tax=Actinoplanes aureus TaxID=2792083 RepID=A0A931CBB3_9ACTN|nr:DUF6223 family protein [Actinoplanes aureus]MBG0565549.1 hypothetical protein [Actinoplanes aureus]
MEYELGSGRLIPTVIAVLALAGVIVGWRSLARAGRTGSLFALAAGLVSAVVGGLHAANSAGGLGTGNGLAGAVIAVALGLLSIALGGLALARALR